MSTKAEGFAAVPIWMIRERQVPRNAILVYASLSSRAGYGAIFPSQATIAEESGLSERTVRTMLGKLEELGVIERQRRTTTGKKRVTDGYLLHPSGLVEAPAEFAASSDLPANGGPSTGNEQQVTPLIEIDIDEIDRDTSTVVAAASLGEKFAQPLCAVLISELEKIGVKTPSPIPNKWLSDARLMVDRDERDPHQAKALIEWACSDSFWSGNVHSMPTFRKQYDKLRIQSEGPGVGRGKPSTVDIGREAHRIIQERQQAVQRLEVPA